MTYFGTEVSGQPRGREGLDRRNSEWLGGDPAAVLPGGPFPSVARYDGGSTLMK
jgi:hypothetical protein